MPGRLLEGMHTHASGSAGYGRSRVTKLLDSGSVEAPVSIASILNATRVHSGGCHGLSRAQPAS